MTINQAPLYKKLTVLSFHPDETRELSDVESRLMHLGFTQGESIHVKKKSFMFRGPLLVEVRGRLVALTQKEAELVTVEVHS